MADLPKWVQNKKEYNRNYNRENKVQIAIKLNKSTDSDLIKIYQSIPNKAQWFKDCLKRYEAEHQTQGK